MADYFDELIRTMEWVGKQEKIKFLGQSVVWDGHALFKSMKFVPLDKRIELPVFEDFQMGLSIGLALSGWIPVNVYPRFDFLMIAANQITNHLANVSEISDGMYKPRVITRVAIGSINPLNPGPQHRQDHTVALTEICRGEIEVVSLKEKEMIFPEYQRAIERDDCKPTILIEHGDLYHAS